MNKNWPVVIMSSIDSIDTFGLNHCLSKKKVAIDVRTANITEGSLMVKTETPNARNMPVCRSLSGRFGNARSSLDNSVIGDTESVSSREIPPGMYRLAIIMVVMRSRMSVPYPRA